MEVLLAWIARKSGGCSQAVEVQFAFVRFQQGGELHRDLGLSRRVGVRGITQYGIAKKWFSTVLKRRPALRKELAAPSVSVRMRLKSAEFRERVRVLSRLRVRRHGKT